MRQPFASSTRRASGFRGMLELDSGEKSAKESAEEPAKPQESSRTNAGFFSARFDDRITLVTRPSLAMAIVFRRHK